MTGMHSYSFVPLVADKHYYRSMLGNRDSEVAIFIEDKEMIPSYLNGELVSVYTLYCIYKLLN